MAKRLGKDAVRAAKLIRDGDDLMRATFKELGRLGALGDEAKDAWRGTESIVSKFTGKKLSFRNFGEALAWDAFVAFNAAGEGDSAFDETLSDTFEQWGLPSLPFLQSDPLQSPLTAKAKQMVEGTLLGSVLDPVLDMVQVARYSRAFRKASPAEQRKLISMDAEASVLGQSLTRRPAATSSRPSNPTCGANGTPANTQRSSCFCQRAPGPEENPATALDTLLQWSRLAGSRTS